MKQKKAMLLVLDGFGVRNDKKDNAILGAQMPFYQGLLKNYLNSTLLTHGKTVGLPDGVMGNSEVGHMTLGAGRIIFQDLTRINAAIEDRSFFSNPALLSAIEISKKNNGAIHLMGLLSDGGVHSHIDHLLALLDLCREKMTGPVFIHPFLDGRDTPPNSAPIYFKRLFEHPSLKDGRAEIATICGRYFAMDRDKRWERVENAFNVITLEENARHNSSLSSCLDALETSYKNSKSDEFFEPLRLIPRGVIKSSDSLIFYNFRSDRAREITTALTANNFSEFERKGAQLPAQFVCMTSYDSKMNLPIAFSTQNMENLLGEWLEKNNKTQLRIAETEKYAHVTFFFNGGRELPFKSEDRILVPSPRDVATYDLKPEMSAPEVASRLKEAIELNKYDFILCNFANADMVGHTGDYKAAVKAMEELDRCMDWTISAALTMGYEILITADHGNAEQMIDDEGHLHTQHTLNPVPIIWATPNPETQVDKSISSGGLSDIMPTLCNLLGLENPKEVTGKNLISAKSY